MNNGLTLRDIKCTFHNRFSRGAISGLSPFLCSVMCNNVSLFLSMVPHLAPVLRCFSLLFPAFAGVINGSMPVFYTTSPRSSALGGLKDSLAEGTILSTSSEALLKGKVWRIFWTPKNTTWPFLGDMWCLVKLLFSRFFTTRKMILHNGRWRSWLSIIVRNFCESWKATCLFSGLGCNIIV